MTAESLIRRNPDIVHSNIDGEVVMLSVEQGAYFGLDAVGSRIWDLLETPRRLDDLCGMLTEAFEVEPDRCVRDVGDFLAEIAKQKLITVGS